MAGKKKLLPDTPGSTAQDFADILPIDSEQPQAEVAAEIAEADAAASDEDFHAIQPGDPIPPLQSTPLIDPQYPAELGPMLAHFKPEEVDLDSIYEDPANAKIHNQRNVESIQNSIRMFGQVEPLLVQASSRRIIGGHGRKTAMKGLGWTRAIALLLPLNDIQATALAIALNRSAELGEWDYQALTAQLKTLEAGQVNLQELGWEEFDLQPLFAAEWTPGKVEGDDEGGDGDDKPADPKDHHQSGQGIDLTANQRETVDAAIQLLRSMEADDKMSEGRCLELICADFISRHPSYEAPPETDDDTVLPQEAE